MSSKLSCFFFFFKTILDEVSFESAESERSGTHIVSNIILKFYERSLLK